MAVPFTGPLSLFLMRFTGDCFGIRSERQFVGDPGAPRLSRHIRLSRAARLVGVTPSRTAATAA